MPLSVELGDVSDHVCPCCHRESRTVHGFLYDDVGETSVYFAGFTYGHPVRRANVVLSVGGWGEGTEPEDRKAVALEVMSVGGDLAFTFPAAESSPWFGEEFLGAMIEPAEPSDEERTRYIELARVAVEEIHASPHT